MTEEERRGAIWHTLTAAARPGLHRIFQKTHDKLAAQDGLVRLPHVENSMLSDPVRATRRVREVKEDNKMWRKRKMQVKLCQLKSLMGTSK